MFRLLLHVPCSNLRFKEFAVGSEALRSVSSSIFHLLFYCSFRRVVQSLLTFFFIISAIWSQAQTRYAPASNIMSSSSRDETLLLAQFLSADAVIICSCFSSGFNLSVHPTNYDVSKVACIKVFKLFSNQMLELSSSTFPDSKLIICAKTEYEAQSNKPATICMNDFLPDDKCSEPEKPVIKEVDGLVVSRYYSISEPKDGKHVFDKFDLKFNKSKAPYIFL